jgi:hypothetical protein
MKKIFLIIYFLLFVFCLKAQISQNRIGLGIDYLSLDLPDDMVFSPNINYQRQFNKRLFISTKMGYVNYSGKDSFSQSIPENRKRIMLDIRPSFAVLKYKSNYFKIGAGPSFWYRDDDLVKQIRFSLDSPNQIIEYKKTRTKEVNVGLSLYSEIDIAIIKKISIVGSFGFSTFKKAGSNSILGITTLYNFK